MSKVLNQKEINKFSEFVDSRTINGRAFGAVLLQLDNERRIEVGIPDLLETVKALASLLKEARGDYGQHSPGCSGVFTYPSGQVAEDNRYPCDCGYRDWLAKVREVLGE